MKQNKTIYRFRVNSIVSAIRETQDYLWQQGYRKTKNREKLNIYSKQDVIDKKKRNNKERRNIECYIYGAEIMILTYFGTEKKPISISSQKKEDAQIRFQAELIPLLETLQKMSVVPESDADKITDGETALFPDYAQICSEKNERRRQKICAFIVFLFGVGLLLYSWAGSIIFMCVAIIGLICLGVYSMRYKRYCFLPILGILLTLLTALFMLYPASMVEAPPVVEIPNADVFDTETIPTYRTQPTLPLSCSERHQICVLRGGAYKSLFNDKAPYSENTRLYRDYIV